MHSDLQFWTQISEAVEEAGTCQDTQYSHTQGMVLFIYNMHPVFMPHSKFHDW